ncbi:uncharacterized protein LOC116346467 isoform X2 [Contarinia nasturtii]|uniref:uncharacterized protein LOC116346467 isoform X2 n=1 Tax=Contarinia nasturtii TaxID=265458 RepID=UPI0012D3A236|nr:uncharacterized protein LOC116346467 isoform X2 [Contarinia nasturtii]
MTKRPPNEDELTFEDGDRQLMFGCLPFHIFRDQTNIEELVIRIFKQSKKEDKEPPNFHIKQKINLSYQHLLTAANPWENKFLKKLDFKWPAGEKKHATIWRLDKKQREKVHQEAQDLQRKFMYLPRHVLRESTNILQIAAKSPKHKPEPFFNWMFEKFYQKAVWGHTFIYGLKFNDEKESKTSSSTSKTSKSDNQEEQIEPIASTSKQADKREAEARRKRTGTKLIEEKVIETKRKKSDDTKKPDDQSKRSTPKQQASRKAIATQKQTNAKQKEDKSKANKNVDKQKQAERNEKILSSTPSKQSKQTKLSNTNRPEEAVTKAVVNRPKQTEATNKIESNASTLMQSKRKNQPNPIGSTSKQAISKEKQADLKRKPTDAVIPKRPHVSSQKTIQQQQIIRKSNQEKLHQRKAKYAEENGPAMTSNRKLVQSTLPEMMQSAKSLHNSSISVGQLNLSTQNNSADVVANEKRQPQIENKEVNEKTKSHDIQSTSKQSNGNVNSKGNLASTRNNDMNDDIEGVKVEVEPQLPVGKNRSTERAGSKQQETWQPSDFQKQVIAMDYDQFAQQTNVCDLIRETFLRTKSNQVFTMERLEFGLKFLFEQKNDDRKGKIWKRPPFKNLKLSCECRRNKLCVDKWTQIETSLTCEMSTQYDANDIKTSSQNEMSLNDSQSNRLAALSIHNIADAEIIHFKYESQCDEEVSSSQDYEMGDVRPNMHAVASQTDMMTSENSNEADESQCTSSDSVTASGQEKSMLPPSQPVSLQQNTFVVSSQATNVMLSQNSNEADETQYTSSGNVTASGQEKTMPTPSRPISLQQNPYVDPSHVANVMPSQNSNGPDEETQDTSSGSVIASGQEIGAPQLSQQILSIDQVRWSEFIEGDMPNLLDLHELNVNPLTMSEAASDQNTEHQAISQLTNDQKMVVARSQAINNVQIPAIDSNQNDDEISISDDEIDQPIMVQKEEPRSSLEYHLGDDSDVECLGTPHETPEVINDSVPSQEMCLGLPMGSQSQNLDENLQSQAMPIDERQSQGSILIQTSTSTESSGSSTNKSPFKNVANIQPARTANIELSKPAPFKRPILPASAPANSKKRRLPNDDDLTNIPVPKYSYPPLTFIGQPSDQVYQNKPVNNQVPATNNKEPSQLSPDSSRNYSIEDSSSSDEQNSATNIMKLLR